MCRIGYCPICRKDGLVLTKHHKWRRAVWGRNKKKNGKIIWICRPCHDNVEREITRRENIILKQNPEIYIGTLNEFLGVNSRPKSQLLDYLQREEDYVTARR